MITSSNTYFGYFPDFNDGALLISASNKGLVLLLDIFRGLADDKVRIHNINQLEGFVAFGETKLSIKGSTLESSFKKIDDNKFLWNITRSTSERFYNLAMSLLRSDKPGHQYFDTGCDDVTVIISKGEYDIAFFQSLENNKKYKSR